ncbi:uncharacterized protein LOC122508653 isoform X2 [Leptopilina heterotoma]|uniref:uncharacterized protein LOC122508653 isoform X2 n=1 Tax=Leptopilina heterotoma TaxID=63436 RepID=UPI001CA827C5|nr:uncharacterized protein LOC122508653 isoform X2 [Leptopilina heterotoma]
MNSATFPGNSGSAAPGLGPVPPPPPPPPIGGPIPTLRINTSESCGPRRPQVASDPYEPPAAIQNAMMTKDKKPFTYTPGMGGKLDLSQIRSPRMARRVAKNANDEGIEGPPKSALEPKAPLPPGAANLYIQPQVAVPVFPSTIPSPPAANRPPNVQINRVPPPAPERHSSAPEQPRVKVETKMTPIIINNSQPNSPETPTSPTSPTQVQLSKAPTPWLQNKTKSQDELPEWARRSNVTKSQETSPESPISPPVYIQVHQAPPFQPKQQQLQNRQTPQQQFQSKTLPQQHVSQPLSSTVPLRIEDRPSVFSVKQEPGHHQFQNTQPHHQSRWYQQPQNQPQPVRQDPQQSGGYIIPIMVEGSNGTNGQSAPTPQLYSQPQVRIVPIDNQNSKMNTQRGPAAVAQEPGPIQSKSFRVLQKITSTDADDVDGDQLRKLQLTEDEKVLMNKFKEQVDGDVYLHQEADPRYRGSAIPSRAFRYLQNMTDSGDVTTAAEEVQVNLPASEQTVPEPKKYTGSAIPSRSFRILQAMTTPEAIATQENWQADFISETENNIPGNQQAIFYPPCPNNFSCSDGGWWTYHPIAPSIPNTNPNNQPYTFYTDEDGNSYICYPLCKPNFPASFQQNVHESEMQFSLPEKSPNEKIQDLKTVDDKLYSNDFLEAESQETRIIVTPCTDDDTDSDSESLNSSKEKTRSSSSSDDSESFLAYSTGLNPESHFQKSLSATTVSGDQSLLSDKLDSDSEDQDEECPMYEDNEKTFYEEKCEVDQHVPHRLSVIVEDSPKTNTETEEFPDDDNANTVSVSLPLRFRFSVSENNQDVTTLIVGDSTIQQTEKISPKDDEVHVDFTLRRKKQSTPDKDLPHGLPKIENIETEFTVNETRTDVMEQLQTDESEYNSQMFYESRVSDVVYDLATSGSTSDNYHSSLEVYSLSQISDLPSKQIEQENEKTHPPENDDLDQDPDENCSRSKSKNLLSVQNSREETDDEDSGVTSDMSRIISEVDTDSECCTVTTRKQSKYQRTQTHSRLFRLLTNDSNSHQEDRPEHLNLHIQSTTHDDHYSSNFSSGMTSPEYSPVYEPDKSTQDCYYQTWKSTKSDNDPDILPSMAHKVLDSQKPHWTYKVNVLCPRIRSSKNVPNDLKSTISDCCMNPLTLSFPNDNPLRNSQC